MAKNVHVSCIYPTKLGSPQRIPVHCFTLPCCSYPTKLGSPQPEAFV